MDATLSPLTSVLISIQSSDFTLVFCTLILASVNLDPYSDTKHCIVVFKENFKELYKTFYFKNSVLFTHINLKISVEFLKRQMTLNQRELCIKPQSLWIRGNYSNWGHCKYIRIRKIWYPSKILQILTNEDIPLEIETGCNLQSFKCFI